MTKTCDWTNEFLGATGDCQTCPKCEKPNSAGNGCEQDSNYA